MIDDICDYLEKEIRKAIDASVLSCLIGKIGWVEAIDILEDLKLGSNYLGDFGSNFPEMENIINEFLELLKINIYESKDDEANEQAKCNKHRIMRNLVKETLYIYQGRQITINDRYLSEHLKNVFIKFDDILEIAEDQRCEGNGKLLEDIENFKKCKDIYLTKKREFKRDDKYKNKRSKVTVKKIENNCTDGRVNLFKSQMERQFFLAIREHYPNFQTMPNISISCILDFDKIKDDLTSEERNYFFRGIIDCVVYDPDQDYIPLYFFELDSFYHDNDKVKIKDGMKDKMFSLCGQKLIRIRPVDPHDKQDFKELLRDLRLSDNFDALK